MDDNLRFKNIVASASISDGTDRNMTLMPYAKNLHYENGMLSFALEFFNENTETEIGITMLVSEDLKGLIDNLMMGHEV